MTEGLWLNYNSSTQYSILIGFLVPFLSALLWNLIRHLLFECILAKKDTENNSNPYKIDTELTEERINIPKIIVGVSIPGILIFDIVVIAMYSFQFKVNYQYHRVH